MKISKNIKKNKIIKQKIVKIYFLFSKFLSNFFHHKLFLTNSIASLLKYDDHFNFQQTGVKNTRNGFLKFISLIVHYNTNNNYYKFIETYKSSNRKRCDMTSIENTIFEVYHLLISVSQHCLQ